MAPKHLNVLRPGTWVALSAALPGVGAMGLAAWLVGDPEVAAWFQAWGPDGGGWLVIALLLAMGAIGCGMSLLPTHAIGILAGWSLGLGVGGLVAWAGVMAAAGLGYELGRLLGGPGLLRALETMPRARRLHQALAAVPDDDPRAARRRLTGLVGLTRLSPVFPFAATNALLAALAIDRRAVILGTAWGMLPRLLVGVAFGAGLSELNFDAPLAPWLIALGVVATLAVLLVISYIARRQWRLAVAESGALSK